MASLFTWLALTSSVRAETQSSSFGIAIGLNDAPLSSEGLAPLQYADDDAVHFFELLSRVTDDATLLAKIDTATQRKLGPSAARPEGPSQQSVERVFARVASAVKKAVAAGRSPVVYVTYSGHGTLDAAAEPGLTLSDGVWTRTQLHAALESLRPAQVHLIVDACHAGAIVGARGAFDRELEAEQVPLDAQTVTKLWMSSSVERLSHVGVVLATAGANQSHEWSEIEGGLFSHEVLSGLLGGADVNADLEVQYSELWAFISAANHGTRDPRARPEIVVRPPDGDFRASLLSLRNQRRSRWLGGDLAKLGHFFVELEGGQRWLDGNYAPGQHQTLALPRDVDAYVVSADREAAIPQGGEGTIDVSALAFTPRAHSGRGALARALRDGFFGKPFGRAYYEGFVDSQGMVPVRFAPAPSAVPADDRAAPAESRRALRLALVAGAAAAIVTGAVAAGVALVARRDYERSELERPPLDLDQRYRRAGTVALVAGGAGFVLGAASIVVQVRTRRRIALGFAPDHVLLRGRF